MTGSALPEISVALEGSPQEVFDYLLDFEQTPQWRPHIWMGRRGISGVGSRFQVASTVFRIPFLFSYGDHRNSIRPGRFRYRDRLRRSDVEGIWECLPEEGGCRFFLSSDYQLNSRVIIKAFLPLIGDAVLWHDYNDLLRLEQALEGGADDSWPIERQMISWGS